MDRARPKLLADVSSVVCPSRVPRPSDGSAACRSDPDVTAHFPKLHYRVSERLTRRTEPVRPTNSIATGAGRRLIEVSSCAGGWRIGIHGAGLAALSEPAEKRSAGRPEILRKTGRLLWDGLLEPEHDPLVIWIFLRLFGAIYLFAFASLGVQILGLIGAGGILPVDEYLTAARQGWGVVAYWRLPTVFWLATSNSVLIFTTIVGGALAALILLDRWVRLSLVGSFLLYLSLVYAGQIFTNFQWDLLLLESGFLAIFLTLHSRVVVWLYRWLLFRFLFLAGAAKLLSGDPTWRKLTALDYHFWTQPLPTPVAWYAARLPHRVLAGATAATLVIELGVAFLIFSPRRPRAVAACAILLFQLLIMLTGNYNFFNLLTMLLCIFLFDDAAFGRCIPVWLATRARQQAAAPERTAAALVVSIALVIVPAGLNRIWQTFTKTDLPLAGTLAQAISPLLIVNPYGLFATTTTTRPEIIIEGSDDGKVWSEYVFRYKPGPVTRRPTWNIPHQPRLDWQMWFAAYGNATQNAWFVGLMRQLLRNSPHVAALLEINPFPDHSPKYVRALLYDYHFSDPDTYARTGQWWVRQLEGLYFPQVGLVDLPPHEP